MAAPSVTYTLVNGTANDSGQVNTNFSDLVAALTDGMKDIAAATFTGTHMTSSVDLYKALVPIGSIIGHYDFSGALTFDTTYWKYCDGTAGVTVGGVSRTLPDLSGRYLVGFGGATDGAGDLDTATWATTVVGNALHQIDVAHTHTGPSHTHTGPSHIHTMFYTFDAGSDRLGVPDAQRTADSSSLGSGIPQFRDTSFVIAATDYALSANAVHRFDTKAAGTGATGAGGTGATGSTGSATQSIQPRSIRVRFIMRAA